jgi:hypothetical protein
MLAKRIQTPIINGVSTLSKSTCETGYRFISWCSSELPASVSLFAELGGDWSVISFDVEGFALSEPFGWLKKSSFLSRVCVWVGRKFCGGNLFWFANQFILKITASFSSKFKLTAFD